MLFFMSCLHRLMVNRPLLLLGVLALAPVLRAADSKPASDQPTPLPRPVVIPRFNSTVTIDGNLHESVWAKAAVIKPLLLNDGSPPGGEPTEVRLWYNQHALFLGWICRDTNILATMTNRDDQLWEEEAVEFFITPNGLERYFEFQWNPLATTFDAVVTNALDSQGKSRSYRFDPTFNATNLTAAVVVNGSTSDASDRDESWQVEAMIPFTAFGPAPPKPGDVWRGNFFRINRGTNQASQFFSWSPTGSPWFHQPNRFGDLEFGD